MPAAQPEQLPHNPVEATCQPSQQPRQQQQQQQQRAFARRSLEDSRQPATTRLGPHEGLCRPCNRHCRVGNPYNNRPHPAQQLLCGLSPQPGPPPSVSVAHPANCQQNPCQGLQCSSCSRLTTSVCIKAVTNTKPLPRTRCMPCGFNYLSSPAHGDHVTGTPYSFTAAAAGGTTSCKRSHDDGTQPPASPRPSPNIADLATTSSSTQCSQTKPHSKLEKAKLQMSESILHQKRSCHPSADQKRAAQIAGNAIATRAPCAGTVAIRIGGWEPAAPMPLLTAMMG
jgi:hypothetical protein